MFLYLLLTAAIVATPEAPTTENSVQEQQELQEIIALFTQEEDKQENSLSTVATATEKMVTPAATTPIKITNAIKPSMLAYKHWTGTYSPETFTIKVNGTEIAQGACYELTAADAPLEISYSYSFMNGMRTGEKTIAYKLDEKSTQANITFSWKDNWKVLVDNGVAVKEVSV